MTDLKKNHSVFYNKLNQTQVNIPSTSVMMVLPCIKRYGLSGEYAGISITSRQLAVVKGTADGCTYKEIAKLLGITDKTVSIHWQRVKLKLGLKRKSEVIKVLSYLFDEIT